MMSHSRWDSSESSPGVDGFAQILLGGSIFRIYENPASNFNATR
jgi:hypothetical protein